MTGRVKVAASAEADRRAPEAMLCDVEVVTKSGERYTAEVPYHKGHYKNPMTDAEVEAKFRSLAQDLLSSNPNRRPVGKSCGTWSKWRILGRLLRLTRI